MDKKINQLSHDFETLKIKPKNMEANVSHGRRQGLNEIIPHDYIFFKKHARMMHAVQLEGYNLMHAWCIYPLYGTDILLRQYFSKFME